jgi:hypothetical protein
MKKTIFSLSILIILSACGSETGTKSSSDTTSNNENPSYDPNRGLGRHKTVDLGEGIDATLANAGESIVKVKCTSCHKLGSDRLVGPGLKGVTERRTPVWLMNFITDPDPMIDQDPILQEQLELCLVRMPNQNIDDDEARSIVEFLRSNDNN